MGSGKKDGDFPSGLAREAQEVPGNLNLKNQFPRQQEKLWFPGALQSVHQNPSV